MSRTIRRGKPSRNFARYLKLGVIRHENAGFFYPDGKFAYSWEDRNVKSYDQYLRKTIREFHGDYYSYCFSGVPRKARKLDTNAQKAKHLQAIRVAVSTGDFDVCLVRLKKFYSWNHY